MVAEAELVGVLSPHGLKAEEGGQAAGMAG